MLAIDQRDGLRRMFDSEQPDAVSDATLVEFKLEVTSVVGPHSTAVLLDPVFGAVQAINAGALTPAVGLIVALEETGYEDLPSNRRSRTTPDWSAERIARIGGSAVKLLVYYHPEAGHAPSQRHLIDEVARACDMNEIPLIIEPLSFSIDPNVARIGGNERCSVVIESARQLSAIDGVDLLKAEAPFDPVEVPRSEWFALCEQLTDASKVPWVLLSSGMPFELFEDVTSVACQAGASGVLAGRSLWREAVHMPKQERTEFLQTVVVERVNRLRTAIQTAHPVAVVGDHRRI